MLKISEIIKASEDHDAFRLLPEKLGIHTKSLKQKSPLANRSLGKDRPSSGNIPKPAPNIAQWSAGAGRDVTTAQPTTRRNPRASLSPDQSQRVPAPASWRRFRVQNTSQWEGIFFSLSSKCISTLHSDERNFPSLETLATMVHFMYIKTNPTIPQYCNHKLI